MPDHTTHHDDCGCLSARYKSAIADMDALNKRQAEMYAKEIDRHEAQIAALKHDEATLLEDADYMRQRIAALEAERGEWRAAAGREIAVAYAHANDLRDALEAMRVNYGGELGACFCPAAWLRRDHHPRCDKATAALAQTPAQSLAAHDAAVIARYVEGNNKQEVKP